MGLGCFLDRPGVITFDVSIFKYTALFWVEKEYI
jgi:hypothetical protein